MERKRLKLNFNVSARFVIALKEFRIFLQFHFCDIFTDRPQK